MALHERVHTGMLNINQDVSLNKCQMCGDPSHELQYDNKGKMLDCCWSFLRLLLIHYFQVFAAESRARHQL